MAGGLLPLKFAMGGYSNGSLKLPLLVTRCVDTYVEVSPTQRTFAALSEQIMRSVGLNNIKQRHAHDTRRAAYYMFPVLIVDVSHVNCSFNASIALTACNSPLCNLTSIVSATVSWPAGKLKKMSSAKRHLCVWHDPLNR